jgi:hypothetical protein
MHDANRGVRRRLPDRSCGTRSRIGADYHCEDRCRWSDGPVAGAGADPPIVSGQADYVKGDRFFFLTNAASMPKARLIGNLALSFMAKLSSGYWTIIGSGPNGFFAIHARVAELLDDERITKRFFFETDLLFHLGLIRAKVVRVSDACVV